MSEQGRDEKYKQNQEQPVYPNGNGNPNYPYYNPGVYPPPPNMYVQYQPYPVYHPNPYKRKDQDEINEHISSQTSFAVVVLSWIFGVLFSEIFLRGGFGLSVPLLTVIFYLFAIWYFSKKDSKINRHSLLLLIPILLLSFGYLVQDNGTTCFINTLLLIVLIPLQLSLMSKTTIGPAFSAQSLYHTAVSAIARPLGYLDVPFKAIGKNIGKGQKNSRALLIFLGLLIAFPIAAIFISLFIKADGAFGYFIENFFENINLSFESIFVDVFFGTITAVFIAAWFITMMARKTPEKKLIQIKNGLNGIVAATVLTVIDLIFILFVFVQLGYLFAGMKLPNNMSYADYARSGFFELCGVLCIAVILIMVCLIFINKNENRRLPVSVSFLLTIFIACNYVVITSAVYRMLTYIAAYDLSIRRVMVTWLIAVFAVSMIGAVIKIWNPRFHALRYAAVTVIIMTIALNTFHVKMLVADYNVNKYIKSLSSEKVREIDIEYLGSMGPSAAGATYKLYKNSNGEAKEKALNALRNQKKDLKQKSWKQFCFSDLEAANILKDIH